MGVLKRKKTKSYHGCIFKTTSTTGRRFVIEEKKQEGLLDYIIVKDYPLKKNDHGSDFSFKSVDDYFKNGNWIKIGNMYKQE